MKFSAYLKMIGWEYLLVTLVAGALASELLMGFDAGDPVVGTALPVLGAAVVSALLFWVGSSRRTLLPGTLLVVLLAAVSLFGAMAVSQTGVAEDAAGNWLIVAAVIEVSTVAAYALARTRGGAVALLVLTIVVCGVVQLLWEVDALGWSFTAMAGALVLLIFKNYQSAARGAASARSVSFTAGFGFAAAMVAVAGVVGALAWVCIIAPLDPSAVPLKLTQETRALETVQARGTAEEYLTPNLDMTSDQTNELWRTTDDLQLDEAGIEQPARPLEEEAPDEESEGGVTGIDLTALQETFDLAARPQTALAAIPAALSLIFLIAAFFVGRRWWRARRLAKFQSQGPTEQVRSIYLFLVDRFGRLGHPVPAGMTPTEYAAHNEASFRVFDKHAGGATFADVTRAYVEVFYGNRAATPEEAARCSYYYEGLWKGARERLGAVKYFFKSFRL